MVIHDTRGCDLNATYCIDGMIDTNLYEVELPIPDLIVFDARFIDHRTDSCTLGAGLRLHLQELGRVDTFRLSVTPSVALDFPITLTWQRVYEGFVTWRDLRIGRSGDDISAFTHMLTDTTFVITDPSMTTLDIIGHGDPFDDVDSVNGRMTPEPARPAIIRPTSMHSAWPEGYLPMFSGRNHECLRVNFFISSRGMGHPHNALDLPPNHTLSN